MITPERHVEVTSPQDEASNMNIARGRSSVFCAIALPIAVILQRVKARRQGILATTIEQGNNSGSVARPQVTSANNIYSNIEYST